MPPKKVVVCGATGTQGRQVVDALLSKKGEWNVVALTRSPNSIAALSLKAKGAEIFEADLADQKALEAAFSGAHGVFAMSNPMTGGKVEPASYEKAQLDAIVNAAAAAHVTHVVFTTVHVEERPCGLTFYDLKYEAEDKIKELKINYTFLRLSAFMSNVNAPWSPLTASAVTGLAVPSCKVPWISPDDIGKAAAACFAAGPSEYGKDHYLVGDVLSGSELAEVFSRLRGSKVAYKAPPRLLLKLFAPDFVKMINIFEPKGLGELYETKYKEVYSAAVADTNKLVGGALTVEKYLLKHGYDRMDLPSGANTSSTVMAVGAAAAAVAFAVLRYSKRG